ncbi:MAG: glycoside hydrolase family 2 protein [Bacteroidales bacterium]
MKKYIFFVLLLTAFVLHAQRKSLDGAWYFTLDPFNVGEKVGWHLPNVEMQKWEKVVVPHCFSDDAKYLFYTGNTWYTRKFQLASLNPNKKIYVHFEAVYYKSKIFINGKLVGTHEGGYTPFDMDITNFVIKNAENTISLNVDNSWDSTTIPGSKPLPESGKPLNYSLFFPWINYGGIIRSVALIEHSETFIKNVKIEAEPDFQKGFATIAVKTFLVNGQKNRTFVPKLNLYFKGNLIKLNWKIEPTQQISDSLTSIIARATIPANQVKLWSLNYPNLYKVAVIADVDTFNTNFGIRKLEIKGTKFLLNGEELHLGGANRVAEYPGEGSKDPKCVIEKDLKLMKEANMVLCRIAHYPISSDMLDWADKNGMLLITEAGNWQMTESQMASTLIRDKYKQQAREMIERDWNHPCIIAYSVGNEYQSLSPEGVSWTKDMIDFTKAIDNTRKLTFCSNHVGKAKAPEEEGSQFVDFVSVNIYGSNERIITKIHELYPNKPIYISEFGFRTDEVKSENDRIEKLQKNIEVIRKFDYVMGASIWTFNHYRSRYNGTAADGYRPWGVVTADRQKLDAYNALRVEFSPAYFEKESLSNNQLILKIIVRSDFPRMTIDGFKVRVGNTNYAIHKIQPGEFQKLTVPFNSLSDKLELVSPTGFVVLEKEISTFR